MEAIKLAAYAEQLLRRGKAANVLHSAMWHSVGAPLGWTMQAQLPSSHSWLYTVGDFDITFFYHNQSRI